MPRPVPRLPTQLPSWARELITLYESQAACQFLLHGNVGDPLLLPGEAESGPGRLVGLETFLLEVLLPGFDVVLTYDLGNGVRAVRGGDHLDRWLSLERGRTLPKTPHGAVEGLTRFLRYAANLGRIGERRLQVAVLLRDAHLIAPAVPGGASWELAALASLMREWAGDELLTSHPLVTFLVTENLADLHPLVAENPRSVRVKVPLPSPEDLAGALDLLAAEHPEAFASWGHGDDDRGKRGRERAAADLSGASLGAVERLVKIHGYRRDPLELSDLAELKKSLVEEEKGDLVELVRSERTLDDFLGAPGLKDWLRQDLALWRRGEVRALPKGYLLCGPVGTGKTFLAECLAGEAGVPVVKLKNFRERWVGTTEGNLEAIFRLLQALGRCYVFIDEADQTLGRRDAGSGDSGLSGRVYSMIAQEMGSSRSRGRVIWILASSRPDLVEVDLKRPGRVDVALPLFPSADREEAWALLRALGRRWDLDLPEAPPDLLYPDLPELLTPATAEALAFKTYRRLHGVSRTGGARGADLTGGSPDGPDDPVEVLAALLRHYQSPVPQATLEHQIRLAAEHATDLSLVPERFRAF